jgi:hypothetical protein
MDDSCVLVVREVKSPTLMTERAQMTCSRALMSTPETRSMNCARFTWVRQAKKEGGIGMGMGGGGEGAGG